MFCLTVRVAEFVEDFYETVFLHEVYLVVLDAILMAAVMAVFIIWYLLNFLYCTRKDSVVQEGATSSVELSTCQATNCNRLVIHKLHE
jgi:hypothetical protein